MKKQISQDELYSYLTDHGVKLSRLAKLMGVSAGMVIACFNHNIGKDGKPRSFTSSGLPKLNEALQQMASELAQFNLPFGSDQTFTNQRGATYDPALVPIIKNDVGCYFKLNVVCKNVLGWNEYREKAVFCTPSSKVYGCISRDDVQRINAELRSIAAVLESYEVVPDGGSSSDSSEGLQPAVATVSSTTSTRKGTRTRMEQSFEAKPHSWEDTSLDLLQRLQLFKQQYPGGILFFRVNGGYTVAQEDAAVICGLDPSITPYTDNASGRTTAYMPAKKLNTILPMCVSEGFRVGITDMYGN